MLTQETLGTQRDLAFAGRRRLARTRDSAPSGFDCVYRGERDAGHPMIVVIDQNGVEGPLGTTLGGFDWGWPSTETRHLAQALLVDAIGRQPPPAVRDALATEELAHFPWESFSITGRELLEWVQSRDYDLTQWPRADSAPVLIALPAAARLPRERTVLAPLRAAFVPLFLRAARARPARTPLAA